MSEAIREPRERLWQVDFGPVEVPAHDTIVMDRGDDLNIETFVPDRLLFGVSSSTGDGAEHVNVKAVALIGNAPEGQFVLWMKGERCAVKFENRSSVAVKCDATLYGRTVR
jgi:hypothetical protein